MELLKWLFWIVVCICLVWLAVCICGCSESQRHGFDVLFGGADAASKAVRDLAKNPLIPEPVALALELVGTGLAGIALAWAKMRPKVKLLTDTAKCVIDAVEGSSGQTQTEVKGLVMQNMEARGIYDPANKLVDSLKAK